MPSSRWSGKVTVIMEEHSVLGSHRVALKGSSLRKSEGQAEENPPRSLRANNCNAHCQSANMACSPQRCAPAWTTPSTSRPQADT